MQNKETLKPVTSVTINKEVIVSDYIIASGPNLTYSLISKTGTTLSHLWLAGTIPLPVTPKMEEIYSIPYGDGGLADTAMEVFGQTTDNIIFINLQHPLYNKQAISGHDLKIDIPLDPTWSGLTSGLTTTSIYGSYMRTPKLLEKSAGPCGVSKFDQMHSENSETVTDNIHIGQRKVLGINPMSGEHYESGIVYLFCDDIQRPNTPSGSTATTTTWSTAHGQSNPYTNGKEPFNYRDSLEYYKDKPVGFCDLYGGFCKIFNPDLVNAFDFSLATGGTGTTQVSFAPGVADFKFKTVEIDNFWGVTVIANPGEFTHSQNPTWENSDCKDVYITGVALCDNSGQTVAMAIPNEPIKKSENGFFITTFNIRPV